MSPHHDYLVPSVTRHLRAIFKGNRARIVDIGCGTGLVTAQIAALGHEVTGVDIPESGIERAQKAYPHLRFEIASVYDSDLIERVGGEVDAVVSLEVIEHLFYPKRLLEQAYQMLHKGGALILSTPYHGYWKNLAISLGDGWDPHFGVSWDGGHIKFFSVKTLTEMARAAGFRRIRSEGVGRLPWLWKSTFLVAEK
jgi:2-polyprenyl-3-methyl-5-hydroxy-6-metoxy-1,4-benzoquinol methylase